MATHMECWHECPKCNRRHMHIVDADGPLDSYWLTCSAECATRHVCTLKDRRLALMRRLVALRQDKEFYRNERGH